MERHTSETIVEDGINTRITNNELAVSFTNSKGSETVNITNTLLTNFEVCGAKADAVFLDDTYVTKRIVIETYHMDGVFVGDIISVDGIIYKVELINEAILGAKVSMKITAQRWE